MPKKIKIVPLAEWAKKNGYSDRHVRRLVKAKRIPVSQHFISVMGIEENFKFTP